MAKSRTELRRLAAAVRERLTGPDGVPVPDGLKDAFAAFAEVQGAYEAAAVKTDAAEKLRDAAFDAIGKADDDLDDGVGTYANGLVAAGLGTRIQPFKGFSKHAPSQLQALAYATEVKAVEELVAAVDATTPSEQVLAAGQTLRARAGAVAEALAALTKPQTDYEVALHARDLLRPGLRKALKTFKTHATSIWIDEPATLSAVFAAPPRVQNPRRRRAPVDTTPVATA